MRMRKILDSIPVRVGLALLATAGLVLGIVTIGAGPDPSRWISELSGLSGAPEDSARLVRVSGDSEGRTAADGGDPAVSPQEPGAPTGNGGAGQPGTPATPAAPAQPGEKAPGEDVSSVRVIWWNDTEASPPARFELVLATSGWRPDNSRAASQTGTLTRIPVGEELTLQVFPDGRNGKQIDIPIEFTAEMVGNSEEDAIHVAISDRTVRVLGTPVVEFDVTHARR